MVELKLLGGLSIWRDGAPLSGRAVQRRRLALLALLASSRTGAVSRDKLIGLLWPESDGARARHLLSGALYDLRQTLGEQALVTIGDDVRLDAALVRADVVDFLSALDGGDAEQAVTLYRGAFLDGFFLSGATPEFEQWVEERRNDYARRYAGALLHIRSHAERLRQELELEPGAELVAFMDRLRTGSSADSVREPIAAEHEGAPHRIAPPRSPARHGQRARLTRATAVLAALLAALLAGGAVVWNFARETGDRAPTVVVLPFSELSPGGEAAYFADGIAEELISTLGRTEQLRVVGRTSAFAFRGTALDARAIGRRLGAEFLLEGAVRRSDQDAGLRVDVRLVRSSDGTQLWSETYERSTRDAFAVQRDIATRVLGAVRRRLPPGAAAQGDGRSATRDPEAYTLYLKGRYVANRRTREGLEEAARFFTAAIARDPTFAHAEAGLADAHASLGNLGYVPHATAHPAAWAAARRALALDSTLAEAHAASAYVLASERRFGESERAYRRAIELNPSYAHARAQLGIPPRRARPDRGGDRRAARGAATGPPLAVHRYGAGACATVCGTIRRGRARAGAGAAPGSGLDGRAPGARVRVPGERPRHPRAGGRRSASPRSCLTPPARWRCAPPCMRAGASVRRRCE